MSKQVNEKVYRDDWFSQNIARFNYFLNHMFGKENIKVLEIGSYEGLSTNWILDNVLTHDSSKIYCVDTFEGSMEHDDGNKKNLYERFLNNISDKKQQVEVFRGPSREMLLKDEVRKNKYDFIYIDGSHQAKDVLEDAILSWELLKDEGIMIFDDYLWQPFAPQFCPKIAIDSFLLCYEGNYKLLERSTQVVIQKNNCEA